MNSTLCVNVQYIIIAAVTTLLLKCQNLPICLMRVNLSTTVIKWLNISNLLGNSIKNCYIDNQNIRTVIHNVYYTVQPLLSVSLLSQSLVYPDVIPHSPFSQSNVRLSLVQTHMYLISFPAVTSTTECVTLIALRLMLMPISRI